MTFIEETILSLGAPATLLGYRQLCRCVSAAVDNEKSMEQLQRRVYSVAAAELNTNGKALERNLRTFIGHIWKWGNPERLGELAGYEVKEKPCPGLVISTLATYVLRNHSEA